MFGQRLKEVRKDRGLTQAQLEELVSVSKTTISGWENDSGYPSVDALVQLCGSLDVSADYLFGIECESFIVVNHLPDEAILHLQALADCMRNRKQN